MSKKLKIKTRLPSCYICGYEANLDVPYGIDDKKNVYCLNHLKYCDYDCDSFYLIEKGEDLYKCHECKNKIFCIKDDCIHFCLCGKKFHYNCYIEYSYRRLDFDYFDVHEFKCNVCNIECDCGTILNPCTKCANKELDKYMIKDVRKIVIAFL